MENECKICYCSRPLESFFTLFCCFHEICQDCLSKIKRHICPFCRESLDYLEEFMGAESILIENRNENDDDGIFLSFSLPESNLLSIQDSHDWNENNHISYSLSPQRRTISRIQRKKERRIQKLLQRQTDSEFNRNLNKALGKSAHEINKKWISQTINQELQYLNERKEEVQIPMVFSFPDNEEI